MIRRLLPGLCALLFASTALAAPPSIDGVSTTAGISASATITTTGTSGVLEVPICTETVNGTQPTVTAVTSSGLTFTRRSTRSANQGAGFQTLEIWEAPYSAKLTSQTVSVTMSAGVDDGLFGVLAVSGLNSTATPFDTNGSLPATGANSTTDAQPTPPSFSTSQANDLLLAGSCSGATDAVYDTVSTWTAAFSGHGPGPNVLFAWMSLYYKTVTSAQSSATVPYDATANTVNVRYVDAMTADASGGGSLGARRSLLGVGK